MIGQLDILTSCLYHLTDLQEKCFAKNAIIVQNKEFCIQDNNSIGCSYLACKNSNYYSLHDIQILSYHISSQIHFLYSNLGIHDLGPKLWYHYHSLF